MGSTFNKETIEHLKRIQSSLGAAHKTHRIKFDKSLEPSNIKASPEKKPDSLESSKGKLILDDNRRRI